MKHIDKLFWVLYFLLLIGCASSQMVYKKGDVTVKVTSPDSVEKPALVTISETGAVSYTAPVSFSPQSEAEGVAIIEQQKANAKNVRLYHLISIGCFIGALLCVWRKHWFAAACLAVASPLAQVLRSFAENEKALALCIVLVGLSIGSIVAWHLLKWRGKVVGD